MILYHYEKGDRPIQVGGFWFDYGGKKRTDIPSYLAEMEYIPDWDQNYVCCCNNIHDVLFYFPEDIHRKLNGIFNEYEYHGNIIMRKDSLMEYMTIDSRKVKLLKTLSWKEAMELSEKLRRKE